MLKYIIAVSTQYTGIINTTHRLKKSCMIKHINDIVNIIDHWFLFFNENFNIKIRNVKYATIPKIPMFTSIVKYVFAAVSFSVSSPSFAISSVYFAINRTTNVSGPVPKYWIIFY